MSSEVNEVEEKFEIRLQDANPPRVAFVLIPIAKYAEDKENGMALLHGKIKEAEAHLSRILIQIRSSKIQVGVIGPDGKPVIS